MLPVVAAGALQHRYAVRGGGIWGGQKWGNLTGQRGSGGNGSDFLIGGAGTDYIDTGIGSDVIAFNRGDGQDIVTSSTTNEMTLSLGHGIEYGDLMFRKSGNDLVVTTGDNEQISFHNWYADASNHSVARLQVVTEGTGNYDPTSTNLLNNLKIEQFDFDGLVSKFDQERTTTPTLTSWALSSSLPEFYLGGSDTAAIGGDLSYQYAINGSLSNISATPAKTLLDNTQFGIMSQNLQTGSALQDLSPWLL